MKSVRAPPPFTHLQTSPTPKSTQPKTKENHLKEAAAGDQSRDSNVAAELDEYIYMYVTYINRITDEF